MGSDRFLELALEKQLQKNVRDKIKFGSCCCYCSVCFQKTYVRLGNLQGILFICMYMYFFISAIHNYSKTDPKLC